MQKLLTLSVLITALFISYLLWFSHDLPEYEHWYQMTWKGQDVGYMRQQAYIQGDYYEVRTETRVKTTNQGVDFSFDERHLLRFELAEPKSLITSYYQLASPHHFTEARLQLTNEGFLRTIVNNKNTLQTRLAKNYSLDDYLILNRWLATATEAGEDLQFRNLNPATLEITELNYEINQIQDDLKEINYGATDAEQKVMLVNADGLIQKYQYNNIISLTRVSDESDLTISNAEDYYATQMVPLDKPLGDPMQWRTVRLKVNDLQMMTQLSEGRRQEILSDEIILSADISARAETENLENYYQLPEDEQLRNELRTMALSVTADYDGVIEQLTALRDFVATYIADVPRIQSTDIKQLLAMPEGDCTEHTDLFNALVTSLGYKTRPVNGLVYLGDNFQGFGGHQWSEVYLNGYWVGFDPTWNINSLSATHIRFDQAQSEAFFNRSASTTNYTFELVLRE